MEYVGKHVKVWARGFDSQKEYFYSCNSTQSVLGPRLLCREPRVHFIWVKRREPEADHRIESSIKVNNAWIVSNKYRRSTNIELPWYLLGIVILVHVYEQDKRVDIFPLFTSFHKVGLSAA